MQRTPEGDRIIREVAADEARLRRAGAFDAVARLILVIGVAAIVLLFAADATFNFGGR